MGRRAKWEIELEQKNQRLREMRRDFAAGPRSPGVRLKQDANGDAALWLCGATVEILVPIEDHDHRNALIEYMCSRYDVGYESGFEEGRRAALAELKSELDAKLKA